MKTLYIECGMGASGDMLQGALCDLLGCGDEFVSRMNSLGLKDVEVKCERKEKCGITGEKVSVYVKGCEEGSSYNAEADVESLEHGHIMHNSHHEHHSHHDYHDHHEHNKHDDQHNHHEDHEHHHSSLSHIEEIIDGLDISDKVKNDSKEVFRIIAEAESKVHGKPVYDIHFHEVGSFDAICDIVGFGLLLEKLGADRVVVSPINTGKGSVRCAHGILPVPAPATALILAGVPCYSNDVEGELCTPTGAALLKYYADEFTGRGLMTYEKIGYGLGTKDFASANVVRMYLSEEDKKLTDTVIKLESNLDDMTAEDVAFAQKLLLSAGALEAFTMPVTMKKSRPGLIMTCLCKEEDKDKMLSIIFAHTSTIGIRETLEKRYILERRVVDVKSSFGDVRVKISEGYGVKKHKIEHDCLEKIAKEHEMPINDIREKLEKELEY